MQKKYTPIQYALNSAQKRRDYHRHRKYNSKLYKQRLPGSTPKSTKLDEILGKDVYPASKK